MSAFGCTLIVSLTDPKSREMTLSGSRANSRWGRNRFDDLPLAAMSVLATIASNTIALQPTLPVPCSCTHVRGHGGAKAAVRRVMRHLGTIRFIMRSDVKSSHASIDHHLLLDRLAAHIKDKAVLNLIGQCLRRTAERGGEFYDYERGISLGCPLSPLIGLGHTSGSGGDGPEAVWMDPAALRFSGCTRPPR